MGCDKQSRKGGRINKKTSERKVKTTANKGLAIAGGTSKIHVLYFGRNLYFS